MLLVEAISHGAVRAASPPELHPADRIIAAAGFQLECARWAAPHGERPYAGGCRGWLLALAEDEARVRGLDEIRLYTNEAMTENLAYYPRHGYAETHRAEQDGFRRVFFTKHLAGR